MGRTGGVRRRLGRTGACTLVVALAIGTLAGVAHADTPAAATIAPTTAPTTAPTDPASPPSTDPTSTTTAVADTSVAPPEIVGPRTVGAAASNAGSVGTPAVVPAQPGIVAENVGPWPSAWIWGKDRSVVSYIPGGPTQGFSDLTSAYTQGEHVTINVDCGVASYYLPSDDTPTGISYFGQMDLGGVVGYQDFLPLTTAAGASSFDVTIPDPSLTDPHAPTTFPVLLTVGCTMSGCCVTPTEKFTFMVRRDAGGGGGSTNHPPVAAFSVTPLTPTPGQFHFVSTSTDADAGDTLSYDWNYGDGEPHDIGTNNVHTYKKPGTYTATLTVTDSHGAANTASQQVTVKAPDLGISISFPGRANNDLVPGEMVPARVTLTASADGVGSLAPVTFDGTPLVVQSGSVGVNSGPAPPVPNPLSLSPGASQSFDFTVTASAVGHFTLASTVRAQDAALRPVTPVTATLNGNTPQLDVTLDSGASGVDSLDLVMTVTNNGDIPISQLSYPGDTGITLRPELFPAQERGGVTLQSGPTPALPTSLAPHTSASGTFHFQGTAVGSVGVVANATGVASDGVAVSDAGTGQLQVTSTDQLTFANLSPDDVKDFIIQMVQSNQSALQGDVTQLETTVGQILQRALAAPRQAGQEPIDQGRLLAAAFSGYAAGIKDAVVGLGVTTVVTPAQYYWGNLERPGQIAADFRDATVAAAQGASSATDALVYGLAAPIADAYYSPVFAGDPGEALAADAKFGALADQDAQTKGAAKLASLEASVQQRADQMSADPYATAESIAHDVSKTGTELVVADGLAKGGTKLIGMSAQAATASSDATYQAARRLLGSSGALENLGAGANVSLDTVEALGGITATDGAKIQSILADAQAKFGVDLELQARPSNPYSAQYLNSELGALPKPEVLKVKSFTDVDVVLGADSKALGKVGVFEPKLPSQSVLDSLTPELRSEVQDRYTTRLGEWNQWKDPKSDLNQAFQRASQPGGDVFTFETPGGGAPREYRLDVDFKVEGPNNTLTFFDKPTGRPMVSDIDFHAALDAATGRIPDASVRGQVELYLQNQFKTSGIAFGDHGITVNGFDWPGLGTDVKGTTKWLQFALEHLSPEDARALAELWAGRLGKTPDQLLQGVTPGKFVVKFRADQVTVGPGAAP